MREGRDREQELLELARTEPAEISLKEVDKMVSAFPFMPVPFDWSTLINLNTLLMSSIATFIAVGSYMLLSGNPEGDQATQNAFPLSPEVETRQAPIIESEELGDNTNMASHITEHVELSLNSEEADAPKPLSVLMPSLLIKEEIEPKGSLKEIPPLAAVLEGRRDFEVGEFHSVGLAGGFDMVIEHGKTHSVWAEGDDKKLENLEVKLKDGKLKIKTKSDKGYKSIEGVVVHVTMLYFKEISVAGSGAISVGDFDNLDDFSFHISGSGSIDAPGDIKASKSAEFHIAGSGDMNVDGEVPSVEIHIAGSGDFKGSDLVCNSAEVHIAGSGDVSIHCKEELEVRIAGSGDVSYIGNPRIDQKVTGSGDIHRQK